MIVMNPSFKLFEGFFKLTVSKHINLLTFINIKVCYNYKIIYEIYKFDIFSQ